jgi:hypothetical protein
MRTAAYKVDVASNRRRRENVPRHILCSTGSKKKTGRKTPENGGFTGNETFVNLME